MSPMESVITRLLEKREDYRYYSLTEVQNNAFKAFFDLAQEFETFEEFYALCVGVLRIFCEADGRLFAAGLPEEGSPLLVASTLDEELYTDMPASVRGHEPEGILPERGSHVFAVRGKVIREGEPTPNPEKGTVLAYLEVLPKGPLDANDRLFFQKYANRIGYSMHNRFLTQRNVEHLRFIKTLVADIEHNVIMPNIVYKLFLRNLGNLIDKSREVERLCVRHMDGQPDPIGRLVEVHSELMEVNRGLSQEFRNLEGHYRNTTLFLETLLRRSHFDQGRLTARRKPCNMKKDVILPQLARYADQMASAGIRVDDRLSYVPDEETISIVDVGLMAQVYANLFSNAVKYTQSPSEPGNDSQKRVSYGRELLRDYFGAGQNGIKYNVFNTGPHMIGSVAAQIFDDGYRGPNAEGKPGTGHGLAFVRNVIELHGGVSGYEPTPGGNNFFFILPV